MGTTRGTKPNLASRRRWLMRCALAGTLMACHGAADNGPAGPSGAAAGASSGTAAAPASVVDSARARDEAMRADDPALFDLASKYFPGSVPSSAPGRLARLTRLQLDRTVQTLLPSYFGSSALTTMPRDPLQTNYEYAENLSFNAANFVPFTDWVRSIAERVRAKPQGVVDCKAERDSSACLTRVAQAFARTAARQVVSDAQLKHVSDFFVSSVSEVGLEQATADLVDLVLTSPSFVFREEVQTDATGSLPAAQWAQNLSYTLADAPPEAVGMSAQDAAKVASDKTFRAQTIDRLLATSDARRKLERFFLAWLEVKEPADFTISPDVFPEFTPQLAAAMVEETRGFLQRVLSAPTPSLKQVTQASESLVSEGLRAIYGLDKLVAGGLTPLDPSQRLGIFTQPAVIASHSGPSTTRLVKRGVFFTRKVMCLPLGNPPQGVNTNIPAIDDSSERQRIETGTASATCQGCHKFINPFGFMQENYDPIGRWRTRDQGQPINASISLDLLDEGPLLATTPVEALRTLSASARFQQCFVRQLFRFYVGRDETAGDDPVLRQLFFQLAKDDAQSIVSVLRTLADSSTLSTRGKKP
jgi:Protein of unknown function (DUF1588)/Protein of unknown function (DUF1592)